MFLKKKIEIKAVLDEISKKGDANENDIKTLAEKYNC